MEGMKQLAECGRRIAECENEIKGLREKTETLKLLKGKLLSAKDECGYLQSDNLMYVGNAENVEDNLKAVYVYCEEQRGYLKGGMYTAHMTECEDMIYRIDEKINWYESEIQGLYASISRINSQMESIRTQMQDMEGI